MQSTRSVDYARKLDELDRLLNDPGVPMQPALIWHLLDEVAMWEYHDKLLNGGPRDHERPVAPGANRQTLPASGPGTTLTRNEKGRPSLERPVIVCR
jgi:hypothetical protein